MDRLARYTTTLIQGTNGGRALVELLIDQIALQARSASTR